MHPFDYARASDVTGAIRSGSRDATKFIAGGTNLVDLMKCDVERPAHVVDINELPLATIESTDKGVRIGALARMSDVAAHRAIVENFPAILQALLASASPQLRNAASIGGNLMQRTRCPYFRELTWTPCNKRNPGTGCSAIGGENRMLAVLGTSHACIATHPSDLAVALAALDAVLTLRGESGEREIAATDFHLLPGTTPHLEHDLKRGELITSVFVPFAAHAKRSAYLKVRDRSSYEFALASAAVGLDLDNRTIRSARIALGGVATKPWRSKAAEEMLRGKTVSGELFVEAAEEAMKGAVPHEHNAFKIELGKRTLARALADLVSGGAA
jgi:xanthine dehydrogenase YagS FAD-binding subunit